MRWAGLALAAIILASTVWFAFAAPMHGGDQLMLASRSLAGETATWL